MGNKKHENNKSNVADIDEIAIAVPSEVMEATNFTTMSGEVLSIKDGTPEFKPDIFEVVNCQKLNVRKLADKNAPVLFIIPVGTILEVDFYEDGWAHVRISDDKEGFVMKDFIKEVI